MDANQVALLRAVLSSTGWLERTGEFARAMRVSTREPGGLMLVGTPDDEPWHLAAHLDEESRWSDVPELSPTLVRWAPPVDAPPHLRVGMDRLAAARRGQTLVVVAQETAPVPLLERVDDARRTGATILTVDTGDKELEGLAHEALVVSSQQRLVTFDGAQHLVSAAAGEPVAPRRRLRARLARLLDTISGGPVPD
ncbi:MAG TPA: hypothetical protein VE465_08275 [Streptosporangiaceae bacterium]|nr:hypothetical protein [Streptosporangiaceae bacterium]